MLTRLAISSCLFSLAACPPTRHPAPVGCTPRKSEGQGFCPVVREEEGVKGSKGEGSSSRTPSCSLFFPQPLVLGSQCLLVTAFSERPLTSATSFSLRLSLCPVCFPLCSFSVWVEEWGVWQRARGIRRRCWGKKERAGLFQVSGFSFEGWLEFCGLTSQALWVSLCRLHP